MDIPLADDLFVCNPDQTSEEVIYNFTYWTLPIKEVVLHKDYLWRTTTGQYVLLRTRYYEAWDNHNQRFTGFRLYIGGRRVHIQGVSKSYKDNGYIHLTTRIYCGQQQYLAWGVNVRTDPTWLGEPLEPLDIELYRVIELAYDDVGITPLALSVTSASSVKECS